jgi:riboflavin kinase/FMN adenylyltransferase
MKLIRGINGIESPLNRPVAAIGNFDGVHIGHRHVINLVNERARETGGTSVVVTFTPHPRSFIDPQERQPMITTFDQRFELIDALGVEVMVVLDFDGNLASMPAEDFVSQILVRRLGIAELFVSRKFRFGHGARGNVDLLRKMAEGHGFTVRLVENIQFRHMIVSSSFIREAVQKGEVELAMKMLGRPFCIVGKVYQDTKRGTEILKFPTSNVKPENELLPESGIYAGAVTHSGRRFPAAAYIGDRPTFGGEKTVVETHIIGFSGSLYGQRISIDFFKKIRNDRKFETPAELQAQIEDDIAEIMEFLKNHDGEPEYQSLVWR